VNNITDVFCELFFKFQIRNQVRSRQNFIFLVVVSLVSQLYFRGKVPIFKKRAFERSLQKAQFLKKMASAYAPMSVSAVMACRRRANAGIEQNNGASINGNKNPFKSTMANEINGATNRQISLAENALPNQPTFGFGFRFNFQAPRLVLPKPDHNDIFRHFQVLAALAP